MSPVAATRAVTSTTVLRADRSADAVNAPLLRDRGDGSVGSGGGCSRNANNCFKASKLPHWAATRSGVRPALSGAPTGATPVARRRASTLCVERRTAAATCNGVAPLASANESSTRCFSGLPSTLSTRAAHASLSWRAHTCMHVSPPSLRSVNFTLAASSFFSTREWSAAHAMCSALLLSTSRESTDTLPLANNRLTSAS
mmetsp:Transcript_22342/g.37871  ORF Transcript_22342/g.37871 Transcript_22342/m.37871 type:complete len:200 (+) Transcript_22342:323-922(+)